MVPDPAKSSLGLEYFCTEGDELWTRDDADLIAQGKREVAAIGLASEADVEDGCVVRVPKAYPVYDENYREQLDVVRAFVDRLENCQTIGRNGLHRYNNQDHAMLTGMLAVRNQVRGERNDLWSVNADQEYHEEVRRPEGVEAHDLDAVVDRALQTSFAKLDRVALGLSLGLVGGLGLFLATLILVLRGGPVVGPMLGLLGQYFPGYTVSAWGTGLGFVYGFAAAFAAGWLFAFLRNAIVFLYIALVRRRAELQLLRQLGEYF
jgi:hypothetical protein